MDGPLWIVIGVFLLLFVVSMVLWTVWAYQVPSLAEGVYYYPTIATGRKEDSSVGLIVKLRYNRNTKQGDIPEKADVLANASAVFDDKTTYPEDSEWNLLGQDIAERIYKAYTSVSGVSLQINVQGDANETTLSTHGWVSPLSGDARYYDPMPEA